MSFSAIAFIKAIVLPPAINFILIVAGLLLVRRFRLAGLGLQLLGFFTLLLLSLEPVAYFLTDKIERYPALAFPVLVVHEQAIVVLGAGVKENAPEFGRSIDSAPSLERSHYAAFLQQQTGLPILVSGGYVDTDDISEAAVMAQTLQNSFHIKSVWQEQQSTNTAQNALYSSDILKGKGIDAIFLVTHARHMPRAVTMFEAQGIQVTPAPTALTISPDYSELKSYLPSANALADSHLALHELLGLYWYRLRY